MLSATDLFLIFMFILVWFLALVIIGGFVYCLVCSLLYIIIIFFIVIIFFIIIFFFLFFLSFLLSCVADRVLVLQPGVRPEPLRWESQVQDTGPPETSWPQGISIGKSSPRISISTLRSSST